MEPGLDKMAHAIDRIDTTNPPLKFGKLGWWDKLRMKVHGKIGLDVKHAIFAATKDNYQPDYLSMDIDHGRFLYRRGVVTMLAHSVSYQAVTIDSIISKYDQFHISNLREMYE